MPKPSPKKPVLKLKFEPDAWARFESLIKSAAKMGPRPHDGSRPQAKKAVKKTKARKTATKA